jgi:multiple sugar transport system substrate-binding protein
VHNVKEEKEMAGKRFSRRDFMRMSALTAAGAALGACQPQVIKETVEVEKVVEVEKTVEVEVEKVVEVEKTVEVEVEKVVEVTSAPARDVMNLPNAATGISYEIKPAINDGEPITIQYWEWAANRYEYELGWVQEYMNIYPNVTVELVNVGTGYWDKVLTSVPAGEGPAVFHFHTSHQTEFCDAELMDPMPDYVASQVHFDTHWAGFAEGAFDCPGSGRRHFVPMGLMMPVLVINRTLWEEAGFTDADVPKSWEELREAAKALTKYDGAGRIIQAGFQGNWRVWLQNVLYQFGRYCFTADGKGTQLNNDEAYTAVKFVVDLHEVDKVIDPEFPPLVEGFSSGLTAMGLDFAWITGTISTNSPDLDWFPAPLPTYSGSDEPAVGVMRFPVEAVVNAYASPDEKTVAWDLWHFLYASDQRLVQDVALKNGLIPCYDKLQQHPAIQADPTARALVPKIEHSVVVDHPSAWTNEIATMFEEILVGGVSIEAALQAKEELINGLMADREFVILERNYKYADQMIANQP